MLADCLEVFRNCVGTSKSNKREWTFLRVECRCNRELGEIWLSWILNWPVCLPLLHVISHVAQVYHMWAICVGLVHVRWCHVVKFHILKGCSIFTNKFFVGSKLLGNNFTSLINLLLIVSFSVRWLFDLFGAVLFALIARSYKLIIFIVNTNHKHCKKHVFTDLQTI